MFYICPTWLQELKFDLEDVSCWEHLLAGEPWECQEVAKEIDLDERETILLEKHLDIPPSWVQRLDIPHSRKLDYYIQIFLYHVKIHACLPGTLYLFVKYIMRYDITTVIHH